MNIHQVEQKYIRAGHPNASTAELWELGADNIDNVRRRVAENPKSPQDLLDKLSGDENPEVRIAVAENPYASTDLLNILATDEHVDVRYSLAENPNLPIEILTLLLDDENPYVSTRAQKTLRMVNPEAPIELEQPKSKPQKRGYSWWH